MSHESADIRHLLIDLDGTLLGLKMEQFIPRMIESMQEHFRKILQPANFRDALRNGLRSMSLNSNNARTLMEVFLEKFASVALVPEETVNEYFNSYYEGPFREMKRRTSMVEGSQDLLLAALDHGMTLTLATNPIFPLSAIKERMSWAGIEKYPFKLITAAELMHFCKPDPAYYMEIVMMTNTVPGECLMAGNDLEQDMSAKNVGISTFLVSNDFLAGETTSFVPDFKGDLNDLANLLRSIREDWRP